MCVMEYDYSVYLEKRMFPKVYLLHIVSKYRSSHKKVLGNSISIFFIILKSVNKKKTIC